jgi:hypothetical protein
LLTPPEQSLDEQVQQKRARGGKKSSPPVIEHVVVVKVGDRYDNEVTAKYVIR